MCIFVKILFLYWVLLNIPERIGKIKFFIKNWECWKAWILFKMFYRDIKASSYLLHLLSCYIFCSSAISNYVSLYQNMKFHRRFKLFNWYYVYTVRYIYSAEHAIVLSPMPSCNAFPQGYFTFNSTLVPEMLIFQKQSLQGSPQSTTPIIEFRFQQPWFVWRTNSSVVMNFRESSKYIWP